MKFRHLLLLLEVVLILTCSCQKQPIGEPDSSTAEVIEESEPQYMAYRLGEAVKFGEDIYFKKGSSFSKAPIFATEYGSENFDIYVPCFDAVCNHRDRTQCCLKTYGSVELFTVFTYKGEPALLLYDAVNTCLSQPYSNIKTDLLYEDFMFIEDYSERRQAEKEWNKAESYPIRSEQFVYKDHLYYVEMKSGVRTQYRVSFEGGEPERVFDEDNIIIRTIINDRFYGIRYENVDPENPWDVLRDPDSINYFRSDMNYENIEILPDMFYSFDLQNDVVDYLTFSPKSRSIIDADEEFIYLTKGMKVWKVPDSDIYAEPIMLADMTDKLPDESSATTWQTFWYNDGVFYTVVNRDLYNLATLDSNGFSNSMQWYETSALYSFDIRTGECKEFDITNQNYLITEILYADDKYVYAKGRYVHEDNRAIQGVTMRLTLDTMRYEVILRDSFWEYSAETTTE